MVQGKATGRAAKRPDDATKPRSWWQWLLIYPSLALGLVGSLPTAIQGVESLRWKVPYGTVPMARESHAMFERNLDCLDTIAEPGRMVRLADNTAIHAVACRTGDIMIRVDRSDGRSSIRWLEGKSLVTAGRDALAPIGPAQASEATHVAQGGTPVAVICTKRQRDGTIMRRVRLSSGACVDEIINPYNGNIVAVRPAPCSC
jgi:hypothetical protein